MKEKVLPDRLKKKKTILRNFPSDTVDKNPLASGGDTGSIPYTYAAEETMTVTGPCLGATKPMCHNY